MIVRDYSKEVIPDRDANRKAVKETNRVRYNERLI